MKEIGEKLGEMERKEDKGGEASSSRVETLRGSTVMVCLDTNIFPFLLFIFLDFIFIFF